MHTLRHIVRLILALTLVVSTQSLLMVQIAFQLRQGEIIEKLCVNRDRPELKCDGKCVRADMVAMGGGEHGADHHAEDGHTHGPAEPKPVALLMELGLHFSLWLPPTSRSLAPGETDAAYPGALVEAVPSDEENGVFRPPRIG